MVAINVAASGGTGNKHFVSFITFTILCNAFFISWSADQSIRQAIDKFNAKQAEMGCGAVHKHRVAFCVP